MGMDVEIEQEEESSRDGLVLTSFVIVTIFCYLFTCLFFGWLFGALPALW
jgi:hypothetical protein